MRIASPDLASLTCDQLQEWMVRRERQSYRGRQLFSWLHQKCAATYGEMSDLSKSLRSSLELEAPLAPPRIVTRREADDGAAKYRFRLVDSAEVEGVLIPEGDRLTLCVSTQVGCGMGCTFCATGTMGLRRNLSAGEIVGQLEAVKRQIDAPVTNVVFMGMGEPLANLESVISAIDILLHRHGHGLSRRHLTVSTAGLVSAMEEFVRRTPVKLAVSLNATTNTIRNRIMPINRKYPLESLLQCCRNLPLRHTDRITFEYVLLGGVNDTAEDAGRLVRLLRGIRCKVNLIPLNPFPGLPYERPREDAVSMFQETLAAARLSVFVRKSRGQSLQGACGQLVLGAE